MALTESYQIFFVKGFRAILTSLNNQDDYFLFSSRRSIAIYIESFLFVSTGILKEKHILKMTRNSFTSTIAFQKVDVIHIDVIDQLHRKLFH